MRRKYFCLGALAVLLGITSQAVAGTVTMTFEGLADGEPILNFYNGGFGGGVNNSPPFTNAPPSGPGPNYGVVYSSDSLALQSVASGGHGAFANNPSGVTVAFFLQNGVTMNVAAGFTTGFSFFYSANQGSPGSPPAAVNVYDGLNGTGNLLATIPLLPTGNNGTAGVDQFNHWVPVGVPFVGTAESAVFTGPDGEIAFDDVTIGSQTPSVPEPASIALLAIGGVGIIGHQMLRRKRVAA